LLTRLRVGNLATYRTGRFAGFAHPQDFSHELCAGLVIDTARNVERWRKVAEIAGFPSEMIFLDEVKSVEKKPDFADMPMAPSAEGRR
jgi:hypothetical protein